MIPDDIKKEFDALKAKLEAVDAKTIDAKIDRAADATARLADQINPFRWLARFLNATPLWVTLLVLAALVLGVYFGWGAFVDWAGSRKYAQETSALQEKLKAEQGHAAKAEADYRALEADYEALKAMAEQLQAEVAAQSGRVVQQQKRTATATIAYSNALKTPVAAIEIDASSDKALEASLQRLTDAAREAMRKAGQ